MRGAMEYLDRVPVRVWFGWLSSSVTGAGSHERWLRAEALTATGRAREALPWYASLSEHSVFDLPYIAPAHLRRGEICERLGEREQAIGHYRRVVELWANADPELRPMVAQAEQGLARLGAMAVRQPATGAGNR
jgi:tetratricopeptide (TPR) repeat protein